MFTLGTTWSLKQKRKRGTEIVTTQNFEPAFDAKGQAIKQNEEKSL